MKMMEPIPLQSTQSHQVQDRPSSTNERSAKDASLSLSMKGETKNRNHNTYNDYSSLELLWLPRLVLLLGPRLAKSNWKIWEMGYESPN